MRREDRAGQATMAGTDCLVIGGLLGGGDLQDREEMMDLRVCPVLRVPW